MRSFFLPNWSPPDDPARPLPAEGRPWPSDDDDDDDVSFTIVILKVKIASCRRRRCFVILHELYGIVCNMHQRIYVLKTCKINIEWRSSSKCLMIIWLKISIWRDCRLSLGGWGVIGGQTIIFCNPSYWFPIIIPYHHCKNTRMDDDVKRRRWRW